MSTANYSRAVQDIKDVTLPHEHLPGWHYAIQMACLRYEIEQAESEYGTRIKQQPERKNRIRT